jgi:hypothetical protein
VLALCVGFVLGSFAGCGQGERPAVQVQAQAQAPGAGKGWEHRFFEFPAAAIKPGDPQVVIGLEAFNGSGSLKEINANSWEYSGFTMPGFGTGPVALFKRPKR